MKQRKFVIDGYANRGQSTKLISKESFPFDCLDDVWTLSAEGKKGLSINLAFMHDRGWSNQLHWDIRLALGKMAAKLAHQTMKKVLGTIKQVPLKKFTKNEIESKWPIINENSRKGLKRLLTELVKVDKNSYSTSLGWINANYAVVESPFDPYNIETGALSEFERQSFEHELSAAYEKSLLIVEEDKANLNSLLSKLTTQKGYTLIRLVHAINRRPANIKQLKWNDIIAVGASFVDEKGNVHDDLDTFNFSEEEELQIRIWKAKDGANFRSSVERYSRVINSKISFEILRYRQTYKHCLQLCLAELKIQVSNIELETLLMRCPVWFHASLFKVKFKDKAEMFLAISENGAGFHDDSATLSARFKVITSKLKIQSDRVSNIKVATNRLRHTTGTQASGHGYDTVYIADLLGNTTKAAKRYIDMNDELRANLDNNFVGNDKLIKMFSADISTLQKDERYVASENFGETKNSQSCAACSEIKRPLACYGCHNFIAFEWADHKAIRDEAQVKYDNCNANGDPIIALGKLATQIKWIDITMLICNERIANRSAINA